MGSAGDGAVRRKHDGAGDAQQAAQYIAYTVKRETRLTAQETFTKEARMTSLDDALDGAVVEQQVAQKTRTKRRVTSRVTSRESRWRLACICA